MTKEEIARVAHEVNRAYCEALGDDSQLPWEDAPQWQRDSALHVVEMHLADPEAGPQASHQAWMAQKLAERIKHAGFGHARIEGLPAADWVLVDAGDIVVHLFRPEVRSFYNLERMWAFGDNAAAGEA